MDRSLWLLLGLRARGWLRRWGRNLHTLKGALLGLISGLFFLPLVLVAFIVPRVALEAQLGLIRSYGALGFFAYCVLNVVLTTGERAISYSPAEVNFLFSGPYRPRQLLLYKVVSGLAGAALTTVFLTLVLQHHVASPTAAVVSLFLALNFLYLFSLAVSLLASTAGALAFDRRRKLVLAGVLGLAAVGLFQAGAGARDVPLHVLVKRLARAPVMRVVLAPFEPFVRAATAERVWPDLAGWSLVALAIDLALLGVVLGLNAQFLEASAAASERLYEKIRRMRTGGAWADTSGVKVRFALPMLPWWGGIGPNLWRQLTTASRSVSRVAAVFILFALPPLLTVLSVGEGEGEPLRGGVLALSLLGGFVIFAPTMVGYDFRPDLDRIEALKTLPIAPGRLVTGQLLTPALVLTLGNWFSLALIAALMPVPTAAVLADVTLVIPLNLLLVALENLYFLWFPVRWQAGNAVDFQTMGRQFLFLIVKFAAVGVVAGAAVGAGAAGYFVSGQSWAVGVASAWVVVAAGAAGLVPLVAQAFVGFDVARERLE